MSTDAATLTFDVGRRLIETHPLFAPLFGYGRISIRRVKPAKNDPQLWPKDAYATASAQGLITVHATLTAG